MDVLEGDESIRTDKQQTFVVTKPKEFVGRFGTLWTGHLMDIGYAEPSLYEIESPAP